MRKATCFLLMSALIISALMFVLSSSAQNSWELKERMALPQEYSSAVVMNGTIYAFGSSRFAYAGNNKYYCDCYTQVYDIEANSWTLKTSMPEPAKGFAVASYKDMIYLFGGQAPAITSNVTGVTRVYHPANDTWQMKSPMPLNLAYICANVVNDKIYIMGGLLNGTELDPPVASNATLIYDPIEDCWTIGATMLTGVFQYTSVVQDNRIYVIGGCPTVTPPFSSSHKESHFNQIYSPENDIWNHGTDPPFGSAYGTAGATTGALAPKRIYVLGGGMGAYWGSQGSAEKFNKVYDPKTDKWTDGASLPEGRTGLAVVVVDDKLYAIGGMTGAFEAPLPLYVSLDTRVASATNALYTPIGYGTPDPTYQTPSLSPTPLPSTPSPPSPSPSPSSTSTPTPSPSPTLTPTISPTPIPIITPSPSPTPTQQPTAEPNQTAQPTTPPEKYASPMPYLILAGILIALTIGGFSMYFAKLRKNKTVKPSATDQSPDASTTDLTYTSTAAAATATTLIIIAAYVIWKRHTTNNSKHSTSQFNT